MKHVYVIPSNGFIAFDFEQHTISLSRISHIILITEVIGFGGFRYNIVGNIEVFGAYLY
jgi:hypothetical protein